MNEDFFVRICRILVNQGHADELDGVFSVRPDKKHGRIKETITQETKFAEDLALDSLESLEFISDVEVEFKVDLDYNDYPSNISGLISEIESSLTARD
ncbi:MAG: hypothetical protein NT165_01500 [Candidatus Falkowbacteria bacterium]|nr:hypothetical protein [Candidatus Falkowbacteria bacterium]